MNTAFVEWLRQDVWWQLGGNSRSNPSWKPAAQPASIEWVRKRNWKATYIYNIDNRRWRHLNTLTLTLSRSFLRSHQTQSTAPELLFWKLRSSSLRAQIQDLWYTHSSHGHDVQQQCTYIHTYIHTYICESKEEEENLKLPQNLNPSPEERIIAKNPKAA
jgi:hypothetical protein